MNIVKKISVMLMMVLLVVAMALPAFASTTTTAAPEQTQVQEEQEDSTDGLKAIAAGMAIGLAAAGGAIAMAQKCQGERKKRPFHHFFLAMNFFCFKISYLARRLLMYRGIQRKSCPTGQRRAIIAEGGDILCCRRRIP